MILAYVHAHTLYTPLDDQYAKNALALHTTTQSHESFETAAMVVVTAGRAQAPTSAMVLGLGRDMQAARNLFASPVTHPDNMTTQPTPSRYACIPTVDGLYTRKKRSPLHDLTALTNHHFTHTHTTHLSWPHASTKGGVFANASPSQARMLHGHISIFSSSKQPLQCETSNPWWVSQVN